MSDIQIYYADMPSNVSNTIKRNNYEIDSIVRMGPKSISELQTDLRQIKNFCRNEESISLSHLIGTLASNVILYALINENVAGILSFMFNITPKGDKIINFDGICSPEIYKGLGIGNRLIDTLIRIGKFNGIKYINLECKGRLMYYYRKLGFKITQQTFINDSDDDSDDEGEPYYRMSLDLSTVTGGKKKKRHTKRNKKIKRKQTRRKTFRF